jgi:GTP-binding protein HflX
MPTRKAERGHVQRDAEARLDEAAGLARAIDLVVADAMIAPISQIRPATYLGKGKVEEIAALIKGLDVELVVMDCALSPIQQRNLEKAWNAKVLDRTGLILEIFGRRADQGRLAAGRARASHLPALAAGALLDPSGAPARRLRLHGRPRRDPDRGRPPPDQRQDRQARSASWRRCRRTRRLHRAGRQRVPYPVVALVGYTNAGKSTLFNRLTRAEVLAADMLFATLDPTCARSAAAWRQGDPVRHGRLHLRPADAAGRRLPRHAGGGAGGRRHPARARHLA